jgi:hypothetical protein
MILADRVTAEIPNRLTSDIIFNVSNDVNSEFISNVAGTIVRTV